MGLFEAKGILPVHQDINDGGIDINNTSDRTVCMHDISFSPANAQFQMNDNCQVASFFSVAYYNYRLVISYHVLPILETENYNNFLKALEHTDNTSDLVQLINQTLDAEVSDKINAMINHVEPTTG
eukprot:TRINITY_DN3886_c0_g1_i1.p1 TRINITY_DN3886_c0_g1~~TRINITY_DN3886_c0_g1_i1.p1  ORF type:complete len:126 (+),score=17.74 TRINITY_DN3886_c0_g1_i1:546-923(+)